MTSPTVGPAAALPGDVRERLAAYTAELDRAHPGLLEGLYVVGSIALGDFHPGLSNIDAVAVAGRPWDADGRKGAQRAGRTLDVGRPAVVAHVTWDELAADPRRLAEPLANAFTWRILRDDAMVERGPDYPQIWSGGGSGSETGRVDAASLADGVAAWARGQLTDVWARWLTSARRHPNRMLLHGEVADRVLTVAQLHQATQGLVQAKTVAGRQAGPELGTRADRILRDAVGFREGSRTSMFWGPLERRRRHAYALISEVIGRAAPAPLGRSGGRPT